MPLDRVLLTDSFNNSSSNLSLTFWKNLKLNPTEFITSISGAFKQAYDLNGQHTHINKLIFHTSQNRFFNILTKKIKMCKIGNLRKVQQLRMLSEHHHRSLISLPRETIV